MGLGNMQTVLLDIDIIWSLGIGMIEQVITGMMNLPIMVMSIGIILVCGIFGMIRNVMTEG